MLKSVGGKLTVRLKTLPGSFKPVKPVNLLDEI
jgi:hypothetical protein